MSGVRVRFTPLARTQLRQISTWWREYRPFAPKLFNQELAQGIQVLRLLPNAGTPYFSNSATDVRRMLLRGSRYHVYYRTDRDEVLVLALWSPIRGTGPDLRLQLE